MVMLIYYTQDQKRCPPHMQSKLYRAHAIKGRSHYSKIRFWVIGIAHKNILDRFLWKWLEFNGTGMVLTQKRLIIFNSTGLTINKTCNNEPPLLLNMIK